MSTITTRAGKGSPLTNAEVDANFTNLNTDKAELSGAAFTGAITTTSTVDGRDVATDGSKLDGIEAGATADQTAAEIKTAYESNADTNAFTDADESKLDGIEASADVTDTANVTAAGALMDSELTSIASVKALDQGVATTDSPTFAGLTTSADVSFGDNDKAIFGAGSDLQIYHDGSNSYIKDDGTGDLIVSAANLQIIREDTTQQFIRCFAADRVELYHNGNKKLGTTATGIDVTGTATMDGLTVDGNSVFTTADNSAQITLISTDTDALVGPQLNLWRNSGTGTNGDLIGEITFTGEDTVGNTNTFATIYSVADQTNNGAEDGSIHFQTLINGVLADRLEINASGNSVFNGTATMDGLYVEAASGYGFMEIGGPSGAFIDLKSPTSDDYDLRLITTGTSGELVFPTGDFVFKRGSIQKLAVTATGIDVTGTATMDGLTVSGGRGYIFSGDGYGLGLAQTAGQAAYGYIGTETNGDINVSDTSGNKIAKFQQNQDISFYEDTGTTAKFFWDASAESLGIGGSTITDANLLNIQGSSASVNIGVVFNDTNTSKIFGIQNGGSALKFFDYTASAERLRIDTSGNLLVGTTSSPSSSDVKQVVSSSTGAFTQYSYNGGGGSVIGAPAASEMAFYTTSGNIGSETYTERMRITSSGLLEVQHDAYDGMQRSLTLSNPRNAAGSGDGTSIYFNNTGTSTIARSAYIGSVSETNYGQSNTLVFGTSSGGNAPTEAMRIDSSGNLLVGKTSVGSSFIGSELNPTGYVVTSCASDFCGYFNRTTTDGGILQFRKDNATVGSIGTVAGRLGIGTGDAGLFFDDDNNKISPVTMVSGTPVDSNGLLDLGYSGARFKDLYLSGGVYLGGTGAANKLDDYEEGTWTPAWSASTSAVNVSSAVYTKIGNLVTVHAYITNISPATSADTQTITGLPFISAASNHYGTGTIVYSSDADVEGIRILVHTGATHIYFHRVDGNGAAPTRNDWNTIKSSNLPLVFSATYRAQ